MRPRQARQAKGKVKVTSPIEANASLGEGQANFPEDAGQTQVYGQGDVFWETGQEMTVENIGGGDAEIVIFELAPAK